MDTQIKDACGGVIASFGPRKLVGDGSSPGDTHIELADPETAEFWSVFRHDAEGFARCIGDAAESRSAQYFAEQASQASPLTVAYLAMGAQRYLASADVEAPDDMDEFVAALIRFAPAIERAVEGRGDLCGVEPIEVASSFGQWAADQFLTFGFVPPADAARFIAEHIEQAVSA